MTNQTSSDIENGSPYANIVQNGTFDSDSDWTKDTGWSIANGLASCNGTQTSNSNIYQNLGSLSGKTINISFTLSNYSAGHLTTAFFGAAGTINQQVSADGDYSFDIYIESGHNGNTGFQANSSFVGSIDNVTVSEVNTGLQGYWKMGDGTNDEYPVIYDQVDPTLGATIVTNGDFTTDISGWSGSASRGSYAWDNGRAKITNDAASGYPNLYQNPTTVAGRVYKVTATVDIGTATLTEVRVYDGATLGYQQRATSGTFEFYFTALSAPSLHLYLFETGNTGHYCYFDNVSIKEVQGNPATMTNMVEGNITNQYPLTKIRNYYRMGDGIMDGYPIIQDQTSPNLAHIPTTNLVNDSDTHVLYGVTETTVSPPSGYTGNAYRFTETTANAQHYARQNVASVTSGVTYTMSMFVKSSYSSITIYTNTAEISSNVTVDTINGTISGTTPNKISDAGNGWWYIQWSQAAQATANTSIYLVVKDLSTYTGSTSNFTEYFGVQLEAQSQATPFLKSSGLNAVRKSSTTNEIVYSNDLTKSPWNINGTTAYGQTGYEGNNNAWLLTKSGASNSDYYNTAFTGVYTFSFYVKKEANKGVKIYNFGDSTQSTTINIENGTHIGGANTVNIENVTNDWLRVSLTLTVSNGKFYIYVTNGSGTQIQSSIIVQYFQVEQQTQVETYAPTTGLPVTIDLFKENNYGTMTNMSASDIVEDTP